MLAGRTSWRLCSLAALLRDLLFHVVTQNGRVTAWAWVLSICWVGGWVGGWLLWLLWLWLWWWLLLWLLWSFVADQAVVGRGD